MVYGRKPRLSAADICFPVSDIPVPPRSEPDRRRMVRILQKKLQGLRFRALEHSIEHKERLRFSHDDKRSGSNSALHHDKLKIGDIVCVYTPSPRLKKLTYQWSAPDHIVISVGPNTCKVRRLRQKKGEAESRVKKGNKTVKGLPSKVITRKMLSSFPVPASYFLGARVMKKFKNKWYLGTVDDIYQDDKTTLWHVSYSDFDGEDMDKQQLADSMVGHPLLDAKVDADAPEIGTLVWYSETNKPALGRVVQIDPTVARPVVVHKMGQKGTETSLLKARFEDLYHEDPREPLLAHITLHQIRMTMKSLTSGGRLRGSDQHKLRRLLCS